MNTIVNHTFIKIITVFMIISFLILSSGPSTFESEGVETNPNTEILIRIHTWKSVSVNNSEYTNTITDTLVEDVRADMDTLGNVNGIVDDWEVKLYSEELALRIDEEFRRNQDKDTHIFQMLIDGRYGTFNSTKVTFIGMEGLVTSTSPVTFAIEIFWDYIKTDTSETSHQVQLNIGQIFDESQVYFKNIIIELPQFWKFNTTEIPEDFPKLFYNDETLFEITDDIYTENFMLNDFIKVQGLNCIQYVKPSNGGNNNGNGNGPDDNDDDESGFGGLSNTQIYIATAVIVVIALAVIGIYFKRKSGDEKSD